MKAGGYVKSGTACLLMGLIAVSTCFVAGIGGLVLGRDSGPTVGNQNPSVPVTQVATPSQVVQPTTNATQESQRQELLTQITDAILPIDFVKHVTLARFNGGVLELEVTLTHDEKDAVPTVSYYVALAVAQIIGGYDQNTLENIAGGPGSLSITTYSLSGLFPYHSSTDYATLLRLSQRSISYEEWMTLSKAGFR